MCAVVCIGGGGGGEALATVRWKTRESREGKELKEHSENGRRTAFGGRQWKVTSAIMSESAEVGCPLCHHCGHSVDTMPVGISPKDKERCALHPTVCVCVQL